MSGSDIHRQDSAHPSGPQGTPAPPFDASTGLFLRQLDPGTILEVETRNNTYTVIVHQDGNYMIWGHPDYCPQPILVTGLGSAYVTGYFREGYLNTGMRLNFPIDGKRISTSSICSIRSKRGN